MFKVTRGKCGRNTDVLIEGKTGRPLRIIMHYYARIRLAKFVCRNIYDIVMRRMRDINT